MHELSVKRSIPVLEEAGEAIMVDARYAEASNFFNTKAESLAGKCKIIGKIGTGLMVVNFIKDIYKDIGEGLGFGQAFIKNSRSLASNFQ